MAMLTGLHARSTPRVLAATSLEFVSVSGPAGRGAIGESTPSTIHNPLSPSSSLSTLSLGQRLTCPLGSTIRANNTAHRLRHQVVLTMAGRISNIRNPLNMARRKDTGTTSNIPLPLPVSILRRLRASTHRHPGGSSMVNSLPVKEGMEVMVHHQHQPGRAVASTTSNLHRAQHVRPPV